MNTYSMHPDTGGTPVLRGRLLGRLLNVSMF